MDDAQRARYDRVQADESLEGGRSGSRDRPVKARAAAALALAMAMAVLAGCGDSPPSSETTTTGATATTATTAPPTTVEPADYHRFGDPKVLTSGLLDRSSPDGTALFVEAIDPDLSKPGCEGQPEPVMFRVPANGAPREAVLVDGATIRGTVVRGPGGRVALLDVCEGFVSEVLVGSEAADGTLTDLRRVPLVREGGFLLGFGWSADGRRLLAGRNDPSQETPADLVSIDPTTGASTLVFPVDGAEAKAVTQVAQLADGTYVVAGFGSVSLRDSTGVALARAPGFGFVLGDGSTVAVYRDGIVLLSEDGPRTVVPAQPGVIVITADFSPDGAALVYATGPEGVESVVVTTLADGRTTTVDGPPGRHLRALFTGDGRGVAFNRQDDAGADPGHDPDLLLVRLGG